MARSQMVILICGICLHILYLFSVFYIYFKSPILAGLQSINVESKGLADRLVLVVADGLRADKLFHRKNAKQSQFLREIIKSYGRWGVSHTRVPTESRVGHVSMMAGTYEDVSAITNGWQDNPVDFDSFFNQSSNTWCWGNPDILNIFTKTNTKNYHPSSYDVEEIDFASKDPSLLDTWVFDKVEKFLNQTTESVEMKNELLKTKTVFFLHLVGIDTNGHAKKPDSKEYLENIGVVDRGIAKAYQQFESFFNHDGRTAYILTSDHGMTPWGAHGSGFQSETETPFVVWGSGIKKPNKQRNINKDAQSMVWELEDWERTDVQQIDLADLMSFLIGTSFPVNSVGKLPHFVLETNTREKALGMYHNVKQIHQQYNAHEEKIKNSALFFTPFPGFTEDFTLKIATAIHTDSSEHVDYQMVLNQASAWIDVLLKGIDYYQKYHRVSLSVCINTAFILWVLLLVTTVIHQYTGVVPKKQISRLSPIVSLMKSRLFGIIFIAVNGILAILLFVKCKDTSFVLYVFSPVIIFTIILSRLEVVTSVLVTFLYRISIGNVVHTLLIFGTTLIGLEFLIHAFFDRRSLSIVAFCLAFLPWIKTTLNNTTLTTVQSLVCVLFTFTSFSLGYFPQLQVVHSEENYMLVLLGAFIIATLGVMYTFFMKDQNNLIIALQTGLIVACGFVKLHSVASINEGNGLPFLNQMFSWCIVTISPGIIFMTESQSISRLISTILCLSSIFILTSISYETLFLVVLILHLLTWVALEIHVFARPSKSYRKPTNVEQNKHHLTLDHLRIAFMFVYFIFMSFFGTGNIASINSFHISSTYCFQTVFQPWIQGLIVCVKVLIPLLMVIMIFRSMASTAMLPMRGLFLVILLLTDIMAMHFFFWVKDEGSWLDIGQSLSHFLINLAFVIFLVPFYEMSYYVTGSISLQILKTHTS